MTRKTAWGAGLIAILNLAVLSHLPVYGDVIPSRSGKAARSTKIKVATELARRGVDPRTAAADVKEMSLRDLEYFAADPKRVQLAAGLLLEEWLLAGAFGLVIISIVGISYINVQNR